MVQDPIPYTCIIFCRLLCSKPLHFILSTKSDSLCHFLSVKGRCTFKMEVNLGNVSMMLPEYIVRGLLFMPGLCMHLILVEGKLQLGLLTRLTLGTLGNIGCFNCCLFYLAGLYKQLWLPPFNIRLGCIGSTDRSPFSIRLRSISSSDCSLLFVMKGGGQLTAAI